MDKSVLDDLKARVDRAGRKVVCERLGWPYTTLTNKLNMFCSMSLGDIQDIETVLMELNSSC